ncbi:MAG: hypothetical protein JO301_07115 [Chitinophagaceae bacterium]|nr:hypothetical protein [Chitinophagaceae bacterium]
MIKQSADVLSKGTKGKIDHAAIVHHSEVIVENSYLFSTQLDIVSYELNPKYIEDVENFGRRNLYGKFYKTILYFRRIAKKKNVKISISGDVKSLIDAKPVIDTLPMLILDNAVKYSPSGSEIDIEFYEDESEVQVTVSNIGPYVSPKERKRIFERSFKSEESIKLKLPGLGLGLSFLKFICDIHHAAVSVSCSDKTCKINDIIYAEFKLTLTFPKNRPVQVSVR